MNPFRPKVRRWPRWANVPVSGALGFSGSHWVADRYHWPLSASIAIGLCSGALLVAVDYLFGSRRAV